MRRRPTRRQGRRRIATGFLMNLDVAVPNDPAVQVVEKPIQRDANGVAVDPAGLAAVGDADGEVALVSRSGLWLSPINTLETARHEDIQVGLLELRTCAGLRAE